MDLSEAESRYLTVWRDAMVKNETLSTDCLLPEFPTDLRINDMNANDVNTFNSLHLVDLQKELHGKFGLTDLILEFS